MSRRATMHRSGPSTPGVRPWDYPDVPLFHPDDWPTDRSVWAGHWPDDPLHVASLDYACSVFPIAGPDRVQLAARAVMAWRAFVVAPSAAARYADRLAPTPVPKPEPLSERDRFGF